MVDWLLLESAWSHLLLLADLLLSATSLLDFLPLLIGGELAFELDAACSFSFVGEFHINNTLRSTHNLIDIEIPTSDMFILVLYLYTFANILIDLIEKSNLSLTLTNFLERKRVTWPARCFALTIGGFGLLHLGADFDDTVGVHFAKKFGVSSQNGVYV